ncbi:sulfite exporter TauE/SafE family protein [Acidipila sp. EB88]|uniref:sulfite exporter TauE/SafE family protein n=1 Tax=Acidipila sp. EB88 TaxID=2305226 RepID=UPI000F5FB0E5|nr:sulfite exporter TauE/SafE family protein [Acidipila sp. EB88]RRA49115.1 sulfite exporter TauE/SafE family protein [Acidipila sp. EB88]
MEYLIGFIIAMFIALTGVGAGTITTPLLILFLGVPTSMAVSTGLVFSAAVKLVLVPSQIARRQVNWRVLGFMVLGGLPGVLLGSLVLSHLATAGSTKIMNGLLGAILVLTAMYQIAFSFRTVSTVQDPPDRVRWLALLMFPVGAEVGFSSAGAGALGSAALLSLTSLAPSVVVGTDILFGFLLSLFGSGAHLLQGGGVRQALLRHLIIGGLGGVVVGTISARYIPRRPLRFALWVWLFIIGAQFLYRNAFVSMHW